LAALAQLVEHLTCNHEVSGSNPGGGSKADFGRSRAFVLVVFSIGEFPEWSNGADCKSVGYAFEGSNPPLPTSSPNSLRCKELGRLFRKIASAEKGAIFPIMAICQKIAKKREKSMRQQYYLRQRVKGGNFHVIFIDPVTELQTERSSGSSDEKKASAIAQQWLANGIPGKAPNSALDRKTVFCDYLKQFWDFDNSFYFRELETMGKEPHPEHALEMQRNVERYYRPYFKSKLLCQIDEEALEKFIVYLKQEKHLASSTVNLARNTAMKALRYAKKKRLIKSFDFDSVLRAYGKAAKRGVLTNEEAEKLIALEHPNIKAKIAVLIGYFCGMRMSEVRTLRVCDIHPDRICVSHSWGKISKIKCTKNQEIREIPISVELYREIMAYIKQMYQINITTLLLPSNKDANKPYDNRCIGRVFNKMLERIGIDEETRKKRNLVFHGLRHKLAKSLMENGTNENIAMKIMGWKTNRILHLYSDHTDQDTFRQMSKAIEVTHNKESANEPLPFHKVG